MSSIFPLPNPGLDNSLSGELKARRAALVAKAASLPDATVMRPELEAQLADDLVEDLTFELLAFGEPFTEEEHEQIRMAETDPRYAGPTGQGRPRNIDVFVVSVPLLRGSPSWLSHRPAGSFPSLNDRTVYDSGRHAVVVRVLDDQRSDPDGAAARRHLDTELDAVNRYVQATNVQIAAWNQALPSLCRDVIQNERQRRQSVASRKRGLGPPVIASNATPVPYSLPRKRRPRVQLDPVEVEELGGRMYLPGQDFADALNEMQRSAQFIAEHPAVYELDENGMRDIVLLQLNAAFPSGGTAETFSKTGKTDVRVVTTIASETGFGDCVFKAECKVWDGPDSAREALDQLCDRYLTAAEVRAAIVLFTRPPYERGAVTQQALERLATEFGAERVGDVAGWPVVRVNHPALPNTIEVAIIAM